MQLNWQYLIVVLICGGVLAAGFFFAARQHFMSMDYGFKNSKLKKQLEDLEAEKRRLMLAREISLSPSEIRKATRVVGLKARDEAGIAVAAVARSTVDARANASPAKNLVATTASVRSTASSMIKAAPTDLIDRPSRMAETSRDKREPEITAVAKLR
jgi:hypothetical protein